MSAMYWEKGIEACGGGLIRLLCVWLLLLPASVMGHGSVGLEDDLCVINIGFYKAHFKIYLPESRGQQEFCEDLPETGSALFVMEYLHQGLAQVPMDFRIIHNVTGLGRFARLQDLPDLGDLEPITVMHRQAGIDPDLLMLRHEFLQGGDYLGIVEAAHPQGNGVYLAVFPFRVGGRDFGMWPLFLGLALLAHISWLWLSRRNRL